MVHTRNLVKAGQSSHTISLPKKWLSKHGLKKGDSVYLKESEDGKLILSPSDEAPQQEQRSIHINIDRKDIQTIQREITSAYINNYSSIILLGKNTSKIKEIRNIIHNFVALEIAEQDTEKIIAKDLLNLKEVSIPKTIQRMDIILRSILKDTKAPTKDLIESIHCRDEDINRLYFMVFRILKSALKDQRLLSQLELSSDQVLSLWFLMMNIESISDAMKSITQSLTSGIKCEKKNFEAIHDSLQHSYLKAMKAYYETDKAAAQEVAAQYLPFAKQCNEFLKSNKSVEVSSLIHHCKEASNLIGNIARIVIDKDES